MRYFIVTRPVEVVQSFCVQAETVEDAERIARDPSVRDGNVEIRQVGTPHLTEVPRLALNDHAG